MACYCPSSALQLTKVLLNPLLYLIFTTTLRVSKAGVSYHKGGNQDLRRGEWFAQVLWLVEGGAKTEIQASRNIIPKLCPLLPFLVPESALKCKFEYIFFQLSASYLKLCLIPLEHMWIYEWAHSYVKCIAV